MTHPPPPPRCCGREMVAVVSRTTSLMAVDRERDTPVYWCADCGRQVRRVDQEAI